MDKTIKELMLFSRSMLSILDTEDLVRFLNKRAASF